MHRQQFHAAHAAAFLHTIRVFQRQTKHLITAANAHHQRTFRCQFQNRSLQTVHTQPLQIPHGILGTRKQDQIRTAELLHLFHITQCYALHAFQCIEVRKIRHSRHTDHRNIYQSFFGMFVQTVCQAVFIINIHMHIRYNPYNRHRRIVFQHLDPRIQNTLISPEFVDDQAFDHLLLFLFKQHHGTHKLCKYTASVNISCKQYRCFQHFGQSHIHNVLGFQVNLCRTSCTFHHDNIILCCQRIVRRHNIRYQ